MLELMRRVTRVCAYISAGIAVAFMVINAMDDTSEAPGMWNTIVLLGVAVVLFVLSYGLGMAAEEIDMRRELRRVAQVQPLSEAEWAAEGQLEMPRLAREHGKATRAPTEDDDPV